MLLIVAVTLLASARANETKQEAAATSELCEKAPPHAQPADVHYKLGVAGDPDLFLPGELYTVSLQGVDSGQGPTPFTGFKIWAEVEEAEGAKDASSTATPVYQSLGTFQAYDAQAKINEECKPAVDNATAHPKTEVQVIWSAPLNVVDTCVRLCAQASSAEGLEKWPVLARKLCATPAIPSSFTRQPPIVEPCCACDEAKYEVTFESLWSRNTHPREFPPLTARAHFGDLIGASHTAQYRVWQEGRIASPGMRRLADDGATTALEKELKEESDHIRTIIKARGISWQKVAGGVGTPSTFAVFRVDAKNHLVSLAAKLAPSPDWIVGVSALELCNVNCTWSTAATLPLFPYDAGTDSGIAYTSRRQPTLVPAPVRALRPDWPRDVRSPFFSTNGEMRPFARLRFTRLRLYEKSCDAVEPSGGSGELVQEPVSGGACSLHAWGQWGPCSVSCGEGRTSRQRHYIWPARAYAEGCRAQLTDYRKCHGPRRHCRAPTEYEPDPAESSGPCAVSQWSSWSPCEGCGIRARVRHYVAPKAYKRCHVGYRTRTIMSQAMPCEAGPCYRPPGQENATNFDWFYREDEPSGDCAVTPWSDWSPCSAECGRGRRMRTRLYTPPDSRLRQELSRRVMYAWSQHFAELQNLKLSTENLTVEDADLESRVQEHLDRCQFTLTIQEALCDGPDISCLNFSSEVCKMPMSVGHCRAYEERWFFDAEHSVCEPFSYTGCGGNANNFRNKENCEKVCKDRPTTLATVITMTTTDATTKKLKPTPSSGDNEVIELNDTPASREDVDCETGSWLGWTDCVGVCEFALKFNFRRVRHLSSGSGRQCSQLIKSRACRPPQCRRINNSSITLKGDLSE